MRVESHPTAAVITTVIVLLFITISQILAKFRTTRIDILVYYKNKIKNAFEKTNNLIKYII